MQARLAEKVGQLQLINYANRVWLHVLLDC